MFPFDLLRRKGRAAGSPNSHEHQRDHIHYITTLRGVLGMLRNPEGTEAVFDIEDGLKDTRAAAGVVTKVLQSPEVAACMRQRYLAEPVDIETLQRLPRGTLGAHFAHHIQEHGFDPDYYRKLPVETDLDWVMLRMRQTHDIWHVVTGIDTSRLGEIAVKAFELAQTWRPLAAVITSGGMMRYLLKDPDQLGDAMAHISHGYQLGRHAKPFLAQKWEQGWDVPLTEWRRRVGLPADIPKPGLFQPECEQTLSPPTPSLDTQDKQQERGAEQ
ncbi:MAG: Coq4 family protein [Planctomycetota bacterium]